MTKTSQELEQNIITQALKDGIEIPYNAHQKIIERLDDLQLENENAKDSKGQPLDKRYLSWLHQRNITPKDGETVHVPADLIAVLEKRIEDGEHHVKQVVDVVLEEAFPELKAAKASENQQEGGYTDLVKSSRRLQMGGRHY